METRRDLKNIFGKVLERQIPIVLRQSGSNIITGIVTAYNSANRASTIRVNTTGQVINNARLSKQISTLRIGDEVVIISLDSTLIGRNYIVASFGGNYQNTIKTN